jgi:F like protein
VILSAVESARRTVPNEALLHAFARRDEHAAVREANAAVDAFLVFLQTRLSEVLLAVLLAGGRRAASQARARKALRSAVRQFPFEETERAVAWARATAASEIEELSRSARKTIRDSVVQVLNDELSPNRAAAEIQKTLGLTEAQVNAVQALRSRLEDASDTTVSVFAGRLTFRVPEAGLSDEQIDRATSRYADRLLGLRADMIAETEVAMAENAGLREFWQQQVERGTLSQDAMRRWNASASSCPICTELDGTDVRLDESFPGGFDGPPAHPFCDCTQDLITGENES